MAGFSRLRERKILDHTSGVFGKAYVYNTYNSSFTISYDTFSRTERCYDQVHPGWRKDRKGKVDIGGPLDLVCVHSSGVWSPTMTVTSANGVYKYVGQFYQPSFLQKETTPFIEGKGDELLAYASEAWNKFRPGRPEVNMGVFLGELRELPSQLRETCGRLKDIYQGLKRFGKNPLALPYQLFAKKGGRQAAADYLAYQFGWAPFVGDLIRCYQTSKRIDRILREIRENNGKLRRRGGRVDFTSETEVLENGRSWSCLGPSLVTTMYAVQPYRYWVRNRTMRVWFDGAFRYYIPDIGSLQWKRRTIRKLYGLSLTPEVVWNLIPWSWLIDWFANVGDIFSSMDDGWADNLTAKYAYLMGKWVTTHRAQTVGLFGGGQSVSLDSTFEYTSKQRIAATPYGFGVSFDSLSLKRLAILSALGITRCKASNFFS